MWYVRSYPTPSVDFEAGWNQKGLSTEKYGIL